MYKKKTLFLGTALSIFIVFILLKTDINAENSSNLNSDNVSVSQNSGVEQVGIDKVQSFSLIDLPVLIPKNLEEYKLTNASIVRQGNEQVLNVGLNFNNVDENSFKISTIKGSKIPANREGLPELIVRGKQGYKFSTPRISEIGWIENETLYTITSRDNEIDFLIDVSENLTQLEKNVIELDKELEKAKSQIASQIETDTQNIKNVGSFRYVPERLYEPSVSHIDKNKPIDQTIIGRQASHPELKLLSEERERFGVLFGTKKGESGTVIDKKYIHFPTNDTIWVTEKPIPLENENKILVPIFEENDDIQLETLNDRSIDGYAVTYKHSGNHVINWYQDGSLFSLTNIEGNLPLETLIDIVKSVD